MRALLAAVVERGLDTNRSLLIVIDGAKALHKAVVEVFGAHGLGSVRNFVCERLVVNGYCIAQQSPIATA